MFDVNGRPPLPAATGRHQAGLSLIEVLIALVVLAVGILPMIGLQAVSKRSNFDSIQRTTAAQLAYDLMQRMRANNSSTALAAYEVAGAKGLGNGKTGGAAGQQGSMPNPDCSSAGAICNETQTAIYDVWYWETLLDGDQETVGAASTGGLTLPTACLSGPIGGVSGIYTLTVVWRGSTTLANDTSVSTCGNGLVDPAGNPVYGANGEYRRVASFSTYIAQQ